MDEQKIEIAGADGTGEGFLYTPETGKGPWPGVLFLTDIFGIRPANQGMAKRVAAQGYAVLMPNIFYRTHKLPVLDFEFKAGEERSMKAIQALFAALGNAQMARDGAAFADFLLARGEVKGGKIAVVGYCYTGKMALLTAAEVPGKIAAAASFHGGQLVTEAPDSPHKSIPKVRGELYFGHAQADQSMTAAQIEALDKALAAWGGRYQSEVYPAKHGWTVPGHGDAYNPAQAERQYDKLFDLLGRALA